MIFLSKAVNDYEPYSDFMEKLPISQFQFADFYFWKNGKSALINTLDRMWVNVTVRSSLCSDFRTVSRTIREENRARLLVKNSFGSDFQTQNLESSHAEGSEAFQQREMPCASVDLKIHYEQKISQMEIGFEFRDT